jgi:hypothetical protein
VTAAVVGSGGLLGDRAESIELTKYSRSTSPDRHPETTLPRRALEPPAMPAGKEPLSPDAPHTRGSALSCLATNVCIGAEEPNVQDEPRPWLARLVLLGARDVTAMVVGSGGLFGTTGTWMSGFIKARFTIRPLGRNASRTTDAEPPTKQRCITSIETRSPDWRRFQI